VVAGDISAQPKQGRPAVQMTTNEQSNFSLLYMNLIVDAGFTKGGSITVPLTSCLTGL
jgi:hypothetical protein